MAIPTQHADRNVCIEAAGRITSAAIASGKLDVSAEIVKQYFGEIYLHLLKLTSGRQ